MTETNYCEIDYHTILDNKDIYLCNLHDMAFHDSEGLEPIICDRCNRQKQMLWEYDDDEYNGNQRVICFRCE